MHVKTARSSIIEEGSTTALTSKGCLTAKVIKSDISVFVRCDGELLTGSIPCKIVRNIVCTS